METIKHLKKFLEKQVVVKYFDFAARSDESKSGKLVNVTEDYLIIENEKSISKISMMAFREVIESPLFKHTGEAN